jgi:hypothetical protein
MLSAILLLIIRYLKGSKIIAFVQCFSVLKLIPVAFSKRRSTFLSCCFSLTSNICVIVCAKEQENLKNKDNNIKIILFYFILFVLPFLKGFTKLFHEL